MKKTVMVLAAVAVVVPASMASAGILGDMDLALEQGGTLGGPAPFGIGVTGGAHTYGQTDTYSALLFGQQYGTWTVQSPGTIPVIGPLGGPAPDWVLDIDFTDFRYTDFVGQTSTLTVSNLSNLDLSSVAVYVNATDITDTVTTLTDGFTVRWNVDDVLSAGPTPRVLVAWNSTVPAPGAAALLGLAGAMTRRGRRRR